jgi:hypothetical protein
VKASLHQLTFNGALLSRGFWLYIWEITAKDGSKVYYVGRTGDSSSLNAQSPFARLSQHLGRNARSNALRRNLENRKLVAEECREFRLFACGPIFQETRNKLKHEQWRDITAGLEKALADAMQAAGYDMLNEVKCRKTVDGESWGTVINVFREHFPMLQQHASSEGL